MRVMCCTMYSPSHQALADVTVPNLEEYCNRHGYESAIIGIDNDKWEYKKHEFIRDLFDNNEADAVFYLDVDAIVTNHAIAVESFFTYGSIFVVTEDIHEINGGVMLLRKSNRGNDVNNFILAHRDRFENEQNVINHYREELLYSGMMAIIKHPSFNSYDYSIYPEFPNVRGRQQGHWHEGDFILHTPGAPMDVRLNTLKNTKIVR